MKRALLVPLNAFNSWALIVLVLLVASRIGEQPPTMEVVVASGSCYSCITEYVKELQAASEGVGILEIEIIFFKENIKVVEISSSSTHYNGTNFLRLFFPPLVITLR